MKWIITLAIIFHQFNSGYWILGWSLPKITSLVIDSNGECIKYTGEVNECSDSEKFYMNYLYKKDYEIQTK